MRTLLLKTKLSPWVLIGLLALATGVLAATVVPGLGSSSQEITYTIVEHVVPSPELGIVADKNFKVLHIVPGGAADLAGVKKGDILKAVNAQDLPGSKNPMTTIMKIKTSASTSKRISLIITRGNQEIKLEIQPAYNGGVQGAPTSTPVPPGMYYF